MKPISAPAQHPGGIYSQASRKAATWLGLSPDGMSGLAGAPLAWLLLALVPVLSITDLLPSGFAGRLFFAWAFIAYAPLLAYGIILGRGKPAPALRTRLAALVLAVLVQSALLGTGGLGSPLAAALALLGFFVLSFAGWRMALLACAWASLGLLR